MNDVPAIINRLGIPWQATANCWHFVVDTIFILRGVRLPEHPVTETFTPLRGPRHLSLVACSHNGVDFNHVGIFLDIDGGRVLHCPRPCSSLTTLPELEKQFVVVRHYSYGSLHAGT